MIPLRYGADYLGELRLAGALSVLNVRAFPRPTRCSHTPTTLCDLWGSVSIVHRVGIDRAARFQFKPAFANYKRWSI
jgi:hypothetical protein